MSDPTLYTFSFCLEDCRRIAQALRNESVLLNKESDRACENGAQKYSSLLWEEASILNALASDIDFKLP